MYRILLVDDESLTLEYLSKIIPTQDQDWQVAASCLDGIEALSWLENNKADLVITDIKMPEMTGLKLCEKIKAKYPAQKIIILSVYDDFKFAQQAIRFQVLDYLLKPISLPDLKEMLKKIKTSFILEKEKGDSPVPDEQTEASGNDIVRQAVNYINSNYSQPISLTIVAEKINVSPNYLSFLFHKEFGESYNKYLTRIRMEHTVKLMKENPHIRIYEIPEKVGYVSVKHFSYVFKQYFGIPPSEFVQKLNERI